MKDGYRLYRFSVRRRKLREEGPIYRTQDPSTVADLFRKELSKGHQDREHFYVFHLNIKNVVVGVDCVAIGSDESVDVSPKTVFRSALLSGANALVIAHNHPSGDESPSPDDIHLTVRLRTAGSILGIPVLDHVIVTEDGLFSFHQEGMVLRTEDEE
jgi:DNA repair protein RadC